MTGVGLVWPTGQSAPHGAEELVVPWHDPQVEPSASSLLSWHTRISDFKGRNSEITALREWAESPTAVSVRFITGPGGVGKSRLAADFAETLQHTGWAAGFVSLRKSRAFPMKQPGALLVIDYPEENPDATRELLADLAETGCAQRIRVLLLTRREIRDWTEMISDAHALALVDMRPIQLGRLDDEAAYSLFCSAQERAAELIQGTPLPTSKRDFTEWVWHEPENYRALFIVAAAVHSVLDPNANVFGHKGTEVMQALAEREVCRLHRIAQSRLIRPPDMLARLVAIATIGGPLRVDRVRELSETHDADLGFPLGFDIADGLQRAFLVSDDAIQPMTPDILAAPFVVRVLGAHPENAAQMIWDGMKLDTKGAFHRIGRIAYDAEVVLGIHESHIGDWLVECVQGRIDRCRLLKPLLQTNLQPAHLDAAMAILRTLLKEESALENKASLLMRLSLALDEAGSAEEALQPIREAVRIYRRLSARSRRRYELALAMALNNMSACLTRTGDRQGGLDVSRKAVECYRRVAKREPGCHDSDLALGLATFSVHLHAIGDTSGALRAAQEALGIWRSLPPPDRVRHDFDIARTLVNLSSYLSESPDAGDPLTAITEAVAILRRLSESSPGQYEECLAIALTNMSVDLTTVGDHAHALDAAREAVDIYSRLWAIYPNRYEANLAMSLSRLSRCLLFVGDVKAGVETTAEAFNLRHRLFTSGATRHGPDLASSFLDLGCMLAAFQMRAEAARAFNEGIQLVRAYAEQWPDSRDAQLLRSLQVALQCLQREEEDGKRAC